MNIKKICLAFLILGTGFSPMAQTTVKIALAQMLVEGGKKQENLQRAAARIAEAAKNKAEIILLPEAMDLGWTHSSAKTEASAIPNGDSFRALSKAAKKHHIYVCAGIIEKDEDHIYNAAVLIGPTGKLLLKHRKINELDIAHDLYDQGDRLNVCETEFGKIGLLICADATAKDYMLTRSVGYLGADLILLPSSWAVKPEHDNNKEPYGEMWEKAFSAVCKEFKLDLAAVSNVGRITDGPWKNWKCIGNSMLMNHNCENFVLPYGADSDTLVFKTIELTNRPGRGTTWYKFWNTLK